MKRPGIVITAVLVTALVLISVTGCLGQTEQTEQQFVPVERGDLTVAVNSNGYIEISHDANLSFGVSGRIEKIFVKENDAVKQGQTLAKLDTGALELAVSQAEASLVQSRLTSASYEYELSVTKDKKAKLELALLNAQINLRTAQYNLDKAKDVYRWPEVEKAQAELDKAQTFLQYALDGLAAASTPAQVELWTRTVANAQANYAAAEAKLKAQLAGYDTEEVAIKKMQVEAAEKSVADAQRNLDKLNEEIALRELQVQAGKGSVKLAEQSLAEAQRNLAHAVITAPFDGVISRVRAEEGDTIAPTTPIFHLVDLNQMELNVELDEIDIAEVMPGQEAVITLDALPKKEFKGTVTAIYPLPNVVGGVVMYKVKINFTNPADSGIKAGMSASADIIISRKSNILLVPSRAIDEDAEGKSWVKVMASGRIETREVVTGLSDEFQTEIVSGLSEGDTVVIEVRTRPAPGGAFRR
jgi:HlyD family secretion protein